LVGAGAIGTIFHRALEDQKGNEITFLLRPGATKPLRTKIVDARTGGVRVRERPNAVHADKTRPVVDTVLFCVRADQLEAALDMVGPIAPDTRLAIVTPAELSVVRARYPGHSAVRIAPSFMAYTHDGVVNMWQPPIVKTLVQYDDDRGLPFAEELAKALEAGGVVARARSLDRNVDSAGDALQVVLAGYALASYDADALAADRATLTLIGNAIGEVLKLDGARGFGVFISAAAAPLLRGMLSVSSRMPESWRMMWRTHGPKIDGQTRATIERLVERGRELDRSTPALAQVRARLQQTPAPVTLERMEATK